ncbi:leucine-rich repeat protein [Parabacteroides sp.]
MRTNLQRRCRWLPFWLLACMMTLGATSAWGQGQWIVEQDPRTEQYILTDKTTSLNITVDGNSITIGSNSIARVATLALPSYAIDVRNNTMYTVTAITDQAFSRNGGLISITIPPTVRRLGALVFNDCSKLTTVVFENGSGVSHIYNSTFKKCPNLTTVTLPGNLQIISDNAFEGSGLASIEIPGSVTEIGDEVFKDSKNLATVTFKGDGLTKIGTSAFEGTALTGIELPSTLQEIGGGAFHSVSALTSVTIPESVKTLGRQSFYKSGLTSVEFLGNNITVFGGGSFGKTQLTDITIPDGVETIEMEALNVCEKLESATIPASVTTIETRAFRDNPKLTKITYLGTAEPAIASKAFHLSLNEVIVPDRKIYLPNGDPSGTWNPESWGVASMSDLIFTEAKGWEYDSSAKTLTLDKTVINNVTADGKKLTIGDNSALDLSELSLPDSAKDVDPAITDAYAITAIAAGAFKQNAKLTKITLPATVASVGTDAFAGTITELHLLHADSTTLTMKASGLNKDCEIYVPKDKLANFHSDDPYKNWNGFAYILAEGGKTVAINYVDKDGNAWPYAESLVSDDSFLATKAPVGQTFAYTLKHAESDSTLTIKDQTGLTYENDIVKLVTPADASAVWTLTVSVFGPINEDTSDQITIKSEGEYNKDNTEDKSFNGTIEKINTGTLIIGTDVPTEINITVRDVQVNKTGNDNGITTVKSDTKAILTLEGTNNNLGDLTNNGTLTLTATDRTKIKLDGSITNAGTFMDSTGIVTSVGGAANLTISPMSDQTVITGGSVKLEAKAKVEENAGSVITDYVWFRKGADGEWTQVKPALPAPNLLSSRSSLLRDATTEKENELTVNSANASEYRCEVTSKDEPMGNIITTLTVFATVTLSDPAPDPVSYSVILPEVEGAKTDPQANTYWRTEGDSFSFSLTLEAEYDQSKPVVKAGDKVIEPNADGKYVIESIYEDITISITGIEKNTTVGNAEVEGGEAKVWSDNGVLHIYTPIPARVRVINFIGSPVKDLGTVNGDTQTTLPKGSYIIVIGEKTVKIAL